MRSLGHVMDRYRGVGPGFEVMRLLLAISVVCWHSVIASYGSDEELLSNPWSTPASAILPMFFGLSGFLVMGSALRTKNLRNFLLFRTARMIPALAMEITLSALLFGVIFTTLPLAEYFTSPQLYEYFGSMIGRIRYILPGVFEDNPFPRVLNISLWTIPGELLCYAYLAILMITGAYLNTRAVVVISALMTILFLACDTILGVEIIGRRPPMQFLLMSFVFGLLIYVLRYKIPFNGMFFTLNLVIGLVFMRTFGFVYLSVFCIVYCTVYLGFMRIPRIPILSNGDYSYGIYLYGFPIQQMVVHLLPDYREWYWNIIFALPITIGIAMFSWNVVEKPALLLRKLVPVNKGKQLHERNYFTMAFVIWVVLSYGYFIAGHSRLYELGSLSRNDKFLGVALLAVASLVAVGIAALLKKQSTAIEATDNPR